MPFVLMTMSEGLRFRDDDITVNSLWYIPKELILKGEINLIFLIGNSLQYVLDICYRSVFCTVSSSMSYPSLDRECIVSMANDDSPPGEFRVWWMTTAFTMI